MSKQIPLTQGKFAIVNDEDYEALNLFKWYARKCHNKFYAFRGIFKRNGKRSTGLMHKFIMQSDTDIDHINGNGLDNRKSNLRICSKFENQYNRGKTKNNKSGYKGVSFHKQTGKWQSIIQFKSVNHHLGLFISKMDAAKAYNDAAIKYHGEFANINII